MPRVLLVINATAVGGMEALCVDLAREYRSRGMQVLATLPPQEDLDPLAVRLRDAGARVRRVESGPRGTPLGQMHGLLQLARLLWVAHPGVVHLHIGGANGATPAVFALGAVCRLLRRPLVVTEHAVPLYPRKRRNRTRRWVMDRLAKWVVHVSRRSAELRERNLGARRSRVAVVLNGVPLPPPMDAARQQTRSSLGYAAATVVIGVAARFAPEKHLDDLVAAFALLPAGPDTRLLLVGDGTERVRLEAQIDKLGIGDRTTVTGFQRDAAPFVAAMDLFVLPVAVGSMSIALLEAMALGLAPIITFCGPEEPVIDGETGLCAPSLDPAALGAAISRLVEDAALRARLGRAAAAHVHANFSIERVASEYLAIYAAAAARAKLPVPLRP